MEIKKFIRCYSDTQGLLDGLEHPDLEVVITSEGTDLQANIQSASLFPTFTYTCPLATSNYANLADNEYVRWLKDGSRIHHRHGWFLADITKTTVRQKFLNKVDEIYSQIPALAGLFIDHTEADIDNYNYRVENHPDLRKPTLHPQFLADFRESMRQIFKDLKVTFPDKKLIGNSTCEADLIFLNELDGFYMENFLAIDWTQPELYENSENLLRAIAFMETLNSTNKWVLLSYLH